MRYLLALTLCAAVAFTAAAQQPVQTAPVRRPLPPAPPPPAPPVKEDVKKDDTKKDEDGVREIDLKDVKLGEAKGDVSKPTKITSEDELKKALGDDAAKAVKADFKKEYLLLFQWAGSGGDKLSEASETKDKKTTVTFTLTPGRTRDLRQHFHLFAVPTDAEWKVGK